MLNGKRILKSDDKWLLRCESERNNLTHTNLSSTPRRSVYIILQSRKEWLSAVPCGLRTRVRSSSNVGRWRNMKGLRSVLSIHDLRLKSKRDEASIDLHYTVYRQVIVCKSTWQGCIRHVRVRNEIRKYLRISLVQVRIGRIKLLYQDHPTLPWRGHHEVPHDNLRTVLILYTDMHSLRSYQLIIFSLKMAVAHSVHSSWDRSVTH